MSKQNSFEFKSGFRDVLKEVSERKKRFEGRLDLLTHTEDVFTEEEIRQVIEVKRALDTLVQLFNKETRDFNPDSERYIQICGKYIKKVLELLDAVSHWYHKFSTEAGGAAEGVLGESTEDSIYYMTSHNISLRIKRANITKGLAAVIQPFYEKVLFEKLDGGYMVSTPELGDTVIEYSSPQFLAIQNQRIPEETFRSPLRIYHENDRIIAVRAEKDGETIEHKGDRINKIYQ